MTPRHYLVYRFMELPTPRRNRIAAKYGIAPTQGGREALKVQTKALVDMATDTGKIEEVRDLIRQETPSSWEGR